MRARIAALCLTALAACRGRASRAPADGVDGATPAPDAHHPQSTAPARGAPPEAAPPEAAPPAASRWCWRPLPRVEVRAVDAAGAVWSVTGRTITDETHGRSEALPAEITCGLRGRWALEFARDGAAYLLADARFYARASADAPFAVSQLCSDLGGAPFARRRAGGWSLVSHPRANIEPTMMHTRAADGALGWFATTGLDATTTSLVLDADDSFVALSGGDHMIFVDRAATVAGEVLAARGERFDGLGRGAAGVVAFRDDPGGARVLMVAERPAGPWERVEGRRPPGPPAALVTRVDLARLVAVTPAGVELSDDRGQSFRRVLEAPAGAGFERPTVGWLPGHHLAVATRDGVATDACGE